MPGIRNDGARDLPDVSSTVSPAQDPYALCTVTTDCIVNAQGLVASHTLGGTSASAPAFGGIVAMIVPNMGGRQGNINPALYSLASQQDWTNCETRQNCIFNHIAAGNNAVPGVAAYGKGVAVKSPSSTYRMVAERPSSIYRS